MSPKQKVMSIPSCSLMLAINPILLTFEVTVSPSSKYTAPKAFANPLHFSIETKKGSFKGIKARLVGTSYNFFVFDILASS